MSSFVLEVLAGMFVMFFFSVRWPGEGGEKRKQVMESLKFQDISTILGLTIDGYVTMLLCENKVLK